jgi:hypothetical protein
MDCSSVIRNLGYNFIIIFSLVLFLPNLSQAGDITVKLTTDKTTYQRSQTVKLSIYATDENGKPVTSVSKKEISIKDPASVEVLKTSLVNKGNGYFSYSYVIKSTARTGTWRAKATIKDSSGSSGEATKYFTVTSTTSSDTTAPVTTATPPGGTITAPISVSLARNEAGTTYYTTDGTIPTTSSLVYNAPLTISAATTLKYFSRDSAGNSEAVKTEVYTKSTAGTHATLTWTGYNMCRNCHVEQASDVFSSVHYQWRGASGMTTGPAVQGKFSETVDNSTAFNSYCINILGNWNNYSGCSNCHIGLGVKPTATADAQQLDNIDCLMCHQKDYKRSRPITGGLYTPNAAMTISMDQAVQTVTKPSRSSCLQCHAKGGGGDNFKRGDLTLAHGATTDATFDVHMATTRGNLLCQNCHTTNHHKMAGRGSDLRPTDGAAAVNCSTSTCHATKANLTSGHTTSAINRHMKRVSCQACHISTYAKNAADTAATEATETHRTWQTPEWNPVLNRYEPTITMGSNLTPKYSFWNGTSWGSNMLDTPIIDPVTGAYKISRPNGSINDAVGTRLYPFKYKTSVVPLNTDRNRLVSVDTSVYFRTGVVADAINQGMVNMGFSAGEPYSWVTTDEFQLITHEVPPAAGNALACTGCHKNTARMNLPQMGYALKAAKSIVCSQCHDNESYSDYIWVHDKHVTSEKYDCSFCHTFSRAAERGLKTTR